MWAFACRLEGWLSEKAQTACQEDKRGKSWATQMSSVTSQNSPIREAMTLLEVMRRDRGRGQRPLVGVSHVNNQSMKNIPGSFIVYNRFLVDSWMEEISRLMFSSIAFPQLSWNECLLPGLPASLQIYVSGIWTWLCWNNSTVIHCTPFCSRTMVFQRWQLSSCLVLQPWSCPTV